MNIKLIYSNNIPVLNQFSPLDREMLFKLPDRFSCHSAVVTIESIDTRTFYEYMVHQLGVVEAFFIAVVTESVTTQKIEISKYKMND